jgi:hypothetical protein
MGRKWHAVAVLGIAYIAATAVAVHDKGISSTATAASPEEASSLGKLASSGRTAYHHVWPVMVEIRKPFCCLKFVLYLAEFVRPCHLSLELASSDGYHPFDLECHNYS